MKIRFGLILLLFNVACDVEKISDEEYAGAINQIVQTMIDNRKQEFVDKYVPTKEKFLIASYGTDHVTDGEKAGFYENIVPLATYIGSELSTSFDFTRDHIERKDIKKIDKIEIVDIKQEQVDNINTKNIYCEIYDGDKVFKLEVLGLCKTEVGWMIMSDIAPGYF